MGSLITLDLRDFHELLCIANFHFYIQYIQLAFEPHYFGDLLDTIRLFMMCY